MTPQSCVGPAWPHEIKNDGKRTIVAVATVRRKPSRAAASTGPIGMTNQAAQQTRSDEARPSTRQTLIVSRNSPIIL